MYCNFFRQNENNIKLRFTMMDGQNDSILNRPEYINQSTPSSVSECSGWLFPACIPILKPCRASSVIYTGILHTYTDTDTNARAFFSSALPHTHRHTLPPKPLRTAREHKRLWYTVMGNIWYEFTYIESVNIGLKRTDYKMCECTSTKIIIAVIQ